ncbi:hypothetical protein CK219_20830 [Mesorhizobium sp. WSM4313]|nr:hypothetical protein CK219_20830 [Mesorhizobium sp. WSM4313]TPI85329.1 hypothetical protein FJ423_03115 [Mesorhizobium sp. B2-8-9]
MVPVYHQLRAAQGNRGRPAAAALRSLIGEIVLTPGDKRGEVHAELCGELLGILKLVNPSCARGMVRPELRCRVIAPGRRATLWFERLSQRSHAVELEQTPVRRNDAQHDDCHEIR